MTENQDLSPVLGGYFLQITDTCIITVEEGKITYVNEAAYKALGSEEKDLLGSDVTILFTSEEKDSLLKKLEDIQERTDYFQVQMQTKTGASIDMKTRLVPLILNDHRIIMMECYNETAISALKKKNAMLEEKIAHLSPLDPETHLPSLILLNDRIEQGILRALREARGDLTKIESYLTVIVANIDGLADVFKKYGAEGRRYVMDVLISRFKSSIRSVDTLAKDAGDSFYFLFENIRDKQNVRIITDRLQNCIHLPILYKEESIKLTITLSVALYPDNGSSAVTLIKWAKLNPMSALTDQKTEEKEDQ
ncbi:MAG: PAS domain-containing protein [Alphaproteobacteria bacterium]|nr:PAS domain-containing protein [Alphaproteobacteria bacterium]